MLVTLWSSFTSICCNSPYNSFSNLTILRSFVSVDISPSPERSGNYKLTDSGFLSSDHAPCIVNAVLICRVYRRGNYSCAFWILNRAGCEGSVCQQMTLAMNVIIADSTAVVASSISLTDACARCKAVYDSAIRVTLTDVLEVGIKS